MIVVGELSDLGPINPYFPEKIMNLECSDFAFSATEFILLLMYLSIARIGLLAGFFRAEQ